MKILAVALLLVFTFFYISVGYSAVLVSSPSGSLPTVKKTLVTPSGADLGKTITITSPITLSTSEDVTIPRGTTLEIKQGGSITVPTGRTFTISGNYKTDGQSGEIILVGTGTVVTDGNIVLGVGAMSNSTGATNQRNVVIGNHAMSANLSGGKNVVIGENALSKRTNVLTSVAIGYNAMQYAADSHFWGPNAGGGGWSVAIGADAARGDAGTDYAAEGFVAIGEGALMHQTTGSANTAVGSLALEHNTTANGVVAVGSLALNQNTTGSNNVAMGGDAMHWNTTGASNVAMGNEALSNQTTASRNVGVGFESNRYNKTGNDTVAVGAGTLTYNTASNNVAVGSGAGSNTAVQIANNSEMTYIGKDATSVQGSLSNSTAIGYGAQVVNSNAIQFGNRSVTTFNFGTQRIGWSIAAPTTGAWRKGDRVFNSAPAPGQPKGWVCIASGTHPAYADMGHTVSGSPVITVANPGGQYLIGDYVTVSAGFASLTDLFVIAKTATTITVDRNANATGTATINKLAATWVSEGNL